MESISSRLEKYFLGLKEKIANNLCPPKTPEDFLEKIKPAADRYLHHPENAALQSFYKSVDDVLRPAVAIEGIRNGGIPCQKGCSHCCKTNCILITVEEALELLDYIERLPSEKRSKVISRILASDSTTNDLSRPIRTSRECSLLIDNACSAYASRPIVCRIYWAKSKGECLDWEKTGIPHPEPGMFETPFNLNVGEIVYKSSEQSFNEDFAINISHLDAPGGIKVGLFEINEILKHIYSSKNELESWISRRQDLSYAPFLDEAKMMKLKVGGSFP